MAVGRRSLRRAGVAEGDLADVRERHLRRDPGFEVDAVMRSDVAPLFRMWNSEIELLDAVKAGQIELTGPRWIVAGLPRWLQLSPVASVVQAARDARAPLIN